MRHKTIFVLTVLPPVDICTHVHIHCRDIVDNIQSAYCLQLSPHCLSVCVCVCVCVSCCCLCVCVCVCVCVSAAAASVCVCVCVSCCCLCVCISCPLRLLSLCVYQLFPQAIVLMCVWVSAVPSGCCPHVCVGVSCSLNGCCPCVCVWGGGGPKQLLKV